jgi:UPF0716 protein FxsA
MSRYILLIIIFGFVFIEIYFLNIVIGLIGVFFTLILTVSGGFLGLALAKRQGLSALSSLRDISKFQGLHLTGVFDGFGIIVAAICLILPGFVTDFFGLLLFIGPMRQAVIKLISGVIARDINCGYGTQESTDNKFNSGPIIDGEFSAVSTSADEKAKRKQSPIDK